MSKEQKSDSNAKTEPTIEEAIKILREKLAVLEDKSVPLNKAMEVYKEAAVALEDCYKSLDKAQGEMTDINEQIEKLRSMRGEL